MQLLRAINFSNKFGVLIGHKDLYEFPGERISLTSLASFPPFLRFNEVELTCGEPWNTKSIEKMCELPIKSALKYAKMIAFKGGINLNRGNYFSDHSKLLEFLHNRLFPICDSSRGYKFSIDLDSDRHAADDIIFSILQLQQISRCSHAEFRFVSANQPTKLPVELVSNWLHRTCDENENKKQQDRFLLMYSNTGIANAMLIWDSLKGVDFLLFLPQKFENKHEIYQI